LDGGNIQFIRQEQEEDVVVVILQIKDDVYTELEQMEHKQYFCVRAVVPFQAESTLSIRFEIENAGAVSYPEAWQDYQVCVTNTLHDDASWRRCDDTNYAAGHLSWTYRARTVPDQAYFGFFPPYSYDRHLQLISQCHLAATRNGAASVTSLGHSLQGRDLDVVQIGTGPLICWIICRQHPGETMAEYYAEGLLQRLLLGPNVADDDQVVQVLQRYTFYIVPNMCPDGGVLGHLRTNAVGTNLNREWTDKNGYQAPTLQRSPEDYHVLRAMQAVGRMDCFLDIHGDEEIPCAFISGAERCPGVWNEHTPASLAWRLCRLLCALSNWHATIRGLSAPRFGGASVALHECRHQSNLFSVSMLGHDFGNALQG
jgi:murein tripeptide amidase MpaA